VLTDEELAGMRATSETAMPDTIAVVRPASPSDGILDPLTGVWVPADATAVFSGMGRVRAASGIEELRAVFGDEQSTTLRYILTLPASADAIEVGDRVAVLSGSDGQIGTRAFRVTRVPVASWQIDRRLGVEVIE